MKKMRYLKCTVLLFIMTFMVMGCGTVKGTTIKDTATKEESTKQENTKQAGITVNDMEDRTVTLEQLPEKMVVLTPSDVEILYALGAQDKITAVGEYCNYPKEALEKEIVSTGQNLNLEQIIALAPEVVIMGTMGQAKEQVAQIEDAGIKVITTNSKSIADTYVAIEMLGKISGKQTEAEKLIKDMKAEFASIKEKSSGKKDKIIYFELAPLDKGLWTAGSGTFMQELADIAGVKNAFKDVNGWAEISEEQVLKANPDYIVTSAMYGGKGKKPEEEIESRKNWKKVNAVKNKKIYNGDNDMMSRPGPRLVDAAKLLYEFIYDENVK